MKEYSCESTRTSSILVRSTLYEYSSVSYVRTSTMGFWLLIDGDAGERRGDDETKTITRRSQLLKSEKIREAEQDLTAMTISIPVAQINFQL